jgi:hypothetical protein
VRWGPACTHLLQQIENQQHAVTGPQQDRQQRQRFGSGTGVDALRPALISATHWPHGGG